MKKYNKIFAIAAIAAASLFSAQNANAAVLVDVDDEPATEAVEDTQANCSFEMTLGEEWTEFDDMIKDNPNRVEIVKLGNEIINLKKKSKMTDEKETEMIQTLYDMGCAHEFIFAFIID